MNSFETLINELQKYRESEWSRCEAARKLGIIADPRAVEPLIAVLIDTGTGVRTVAVRICAANALGNIKGPRAVESLIDALADEYKAVRSSAAWALGEIKDPSADNSLNEYHLHPIVSPYFGISPRQKRKLDLSYKDIKTIFKDDEKEYQSFYNNLSKKWQVNVKSKVKSLPKTLWDFE